MSILTHRAATSHFTLTTDGGDFSLEESTRLNLKKLEKPQIIALRPGTAQRPIEPQFADAFTFKRYRYLIAQSERYKNVKIHAYGGLLRTLAH